MSRELATLPLVCVVWLDAHGRTDGEFTAEDIARDHHDPAPIKTFGLLVHVDERGVSIAQEITSEGTAPATYRGLGFIPRGMVQEIIHLGVPRRPAKKRKANGEKPPV
jgi:hypothetical protein